MAQNRPIKSAEGAMEGYRRPGQFSDTDAIGLVWKRKLAT